MLPTTSQYSVGVFLVYFNHILKDDIIHLIHTVAMQCSHIF